MKWQKARGQVFTLFWWQCKSGKLTFGRVWKITKFYTFVLCLAWPMTQLSYCLLSINQNENEHVQLNEQVSDGEFSLSTCLI